MHTWLSSPIRLFTFMKCQAKEWGRIIIHNLTKSCFLKKQERSRNNMFLGLGFLCFPTKNVSRDGKM